MDTPSCAVDHEHPQSGQGSLAGFSIGVTAYRRADDLIGAFARRGARVVHAPVLRIDAPDEDGSLLADTRAIIAARPDVVVVTTAYGVRRWLDSADAAGVLDELTEVIDAAQLLIRGPKARGAVRALGLSEDDAIEGELTSDLIDHILAGRLDKMGRGSTSVALQLHGYIDPAQLASLRAANVRVFTVEPYRWVPEEKLVAVDRLIESMLAHQVDALTFTSAPAVDAFLGRAQQTGRGDALLGCLRRGHVLVAAVGPVTAGPLQEAGIPCVMPERHRLGALIRTTSEWLIEHRTARVITGLGVLELRGQSVRLGGRDITVTPSGIKVLSRLARTPERVVGRAELLSLLPPDATEHALDTTMSKLRAALGEARLIRTVVRRGYALDPTPNP